MAQNIPSVDAGRASSATDVINPQVPLLASDAELITGVPRNVAAAAISGAPLPAYTVVSVNSSNELIKATYSATVDAVKDAYGITMAEINQAATNRACPYWTGGGFNVDALNWDSSFDTEAKKLRAFERMAQNILVLKLR